MKIKKAHGQALVEWLLLASVGMGIIFYMFQGFDVKQKLEDSSTKSIDEIKKHPMMIKSENTWRSMHKNYK